jgi:hypothetical protein
VSTKVPLVINAVLALARTSAAADVYVQDGPPTRQLGGLPKVLVVGGTWDDPDRAGAVATQIPGMGNASRNEQIAVTCSAFAQSGDVDMAPRRVDVFAIVAALENAIVADRSLAGVGWGDAYVSSVDEVDQRQSEAGSACIVTFTVSTTALLWDG